MNTARRHIRTRSRTRRSSRSRSGCLHNDRPERFGSRCASSPHRTEDRSRWRRRPCTPLEDIRTPGSLQCRLRRSGTHRHKQGNRRVFQGGRILTSRAPRSRCNFRLGSQARADDMRCRNPHNSDRPIQCSRTRRRSGSNLPCTYTPQRRTLLGWCKGSRRTHRRGRTSGRSRARGTPRSPHRGHRTPRRDTRWAPTL